MLIHGNAYSTSAVGVLTGSLKPDHIPMSVFVISVSFSDSCFVSTHDCIYGTTPFISMMATGSTGTYRGLEEAPESTAMLDKRNQRWTQVDHPTTQWTDKAVDILHPDEICSPAVHVTCVAIPVTIIVYLLVFS